MIEIVTQILSMEQFASQIKVPLDCGASLWFSGTVRNHNDGKCVRGICYSSYAEMAREEWQRIVDEACARWPIAAVHCQHRIGELKIGEISTLIHVAAPHRIDAFSAMQYIIDELKQRVPIWKQEQYVDGHNAWLGA